MFYQTTITLPIVRLQGLLSLLDTVETQAEVRGMSDTEILELRLAPNMFALVKQIQIATDNAKGMASRMAGKEAPKYDDNEVSFSDIRARLEKTITYLETFTEADFASAVTAEVRLPWFPDMMFVGEGYLTTYALPNFFFHVVSAYAILRSAGFDIGKGDYMGPGLALIPDVK
ncbi:DUF1993 domain-containing protein [Candidatus Gracilibacteria bacterium]|nr:DUF1993 domain-containing protein [Candidatus Gracilibacteria bacterium]